MAIAALVHARVLWVPAHTGMQSTATPSALSKLRTIQPDLLQGSATRPCSPHLARLRPKSAARFSWHMRFPLTLNEISYNLHAIPPYSAAIHLLVAFYHTLTFIATRTRVRPILLVGRCGGAAWFCSRYGIDIGTAVEVGVSVRHATMRRYRLSCLERARCGALVDLAIVLGREVWKWPDGVVGVGSVRRDCCSHGSDGGSRYTVVFRAPSPSQSTPCFQGCQH